MEASARRRFLSGLIVPLLVPVAVPMAVLWLTGSQNWDWAGHLPLSLVVTLSGLALIALGLILFVATIRLFARLGQGWIMPWDPTQELVVQGVYRCVRNPMHTGVFLVLLGDGLVLRSQACAARDPGRPRDFRSPGHIKRAI